MDTIFLASKDKQDALDVFGPTVRFLTPLAQATDPSPFLMHGTIPAGVSIPLHSHADEEQFYVLAGAVQVLKEEGPEASWVELQPGDLVLVPGNVKYAFRNTSASSMEGLIVTSHHIGHFFQEIGRPVVPGQQLPPPTPEELARFQALANQYHFWNGSPEENQQVGIRLPGAP